MAVIKPFIIKFLLECSRFAKNIIDYFLKGNLMEGSSADLISSLLPLVALFAIFYFLIIRPQQKQAKAHKEMVANLKKGDKIVTNGGLIVEVAKVEETYLVIKNNDNSEMKLMKEFVAKLLED
jgi:preprotein translocase subunit YajC